MKVIILNIGNKNADVWPAFQIDILGCIPIPLSSYGRYYHSATTELLQQQGK
jgi:hypothetical protein